MAQSAWVWPSGGERWVKAAVVAVSLALHALVLGYIASGTSTLPSRYRGVIDDPLFAPPVIYAEIQPRPLLHGEIARTRETPRPDSTILSIPDAGTRLTETSGATGSAEAGSRPTPLSPHIAAGAPVPPPGIGTTSWRVRPNTFDDRMARGLGASLVGCASPDLLSPAERAVCDDRFGQRAAAAAPIRSTADSARDARFARAGARALARYEARRAPLSDADDPPCDRPRSPVADCELEISVDLYSSTRGWLPNLRGDDD